MSSAASLLLWVIQFWWNLQFICVCVTCSVCFSGLTYLVFPGAVHTRFEHSLGVYKLAGEAMNNLQKYQVCTIVHCLDWYILTSDSLLSNGEAYAFFFTQQGNELGIDHVDVQTVKLAGWCSQPWLHKFCLLMIFVIILFRSLTWHRTWPLQSSVWAWVSSSCSSRINMVVLFAYMPLIIIIS